jgi:hypothetical protein
VSRRIMSTETSASKLVKSKLPFIFSRVKHGQLKIFLGRINTKPFDLRKVLKAYLDVSLIALSQGDEFVSFSFTPEKNTPIRINF